MGISHHSLVGEKDEGREGKKERGREWGEMRGRGRKCLKEFSYFKLFVW